QRPKQRKTRRSTVNGLTVKIGYELVAIVEELPQDILCFLCILPRLPERITTVIAQVRLKNGELGPAYRQLVTGFSHKTAGVLAPVGESRQSITEPTAQGALHGAKGSSVISAPLNRIALGTGIGTASPDHGVVFPVD